MAGAAANKVWDRVTPAPQVNGITGESVSVAVLSVCVSCGCSVHHPTPPPNTSGTGTLQAIAELHLHFFHACPLSVWGGGGARGS